MPFQLSLCAAISPSKITIVMSTDVTSPCMVSLNLTATVVVGNANAHTYLWEQASGALVVFNTPTNQLTANCTLLDSTDKVFYFWVDKGTANETRYIFNYHGTATETTPLCGSNSAISTGQLLSGAVPGASIIGTQSIFSSATSGASSINPNNIVLMWQLPSDLTGFVNAIVEQDINGVWTPVLTVTASDPQRLTNAQQNTYYRIKTTYILNNQYYRQYSNVYYLLIDVANYNTYIDDVLLPFSNTISPLNVSYFTVLNTDSVTNQIVDVISPGGGNTIGSLSTSLYTLLNLDAITSNAILDIIVPGGSNTLGAMSVVYFGGTAIGG